MKYMVATENNVTLYVDVGAYMVITFSIPPIVEKMKKTCMLSRKPCKFFSPFVKSESRIALDVVLGESIDNCSMLIFWVQFVSVMKIKLLKTV